jgi:Flp pilus assembly protein TadD
LIVIGLVLLFGPATKRWVLLPGVLAALVLISLTWFGLGPVIDRVNTLLHLPEDRSMLGRIAVWKDTTRIMEAYPYMGSGPGTFGAVYPAYKTMPDPVFYEHAHNDYVQLMAETGIVGFGLSVGMLGILVGFVIAGGRARRNPRAKGLLLGVLTGLVAILLHGLNDFNFHIPANAMLFTVLMGMAWNLARPDRSDEPSEPVIGRRRATVAVAGLAVVVLLVYQTTAAFAADRYYHCGLELEKAGKLDQAGEEYLRAIRWDPAHPQYHMALGGLNERRYKQGDATALPTARSEMENAAALAPTLAEPHLHLGWIHAQRRETDAAMEEFDRVLKLDPTNPFFQHYVGLWFAATGQTDRALSLARRLRKTGQPAKAAEIEERLKKT